MRYHQDSYAKYGVLGVGHCNYDRLLCVRPTHVAMVTKMYKFSYKIYYKSGQL